MKLCKVTMKNQERFFFFFYFPVGPGGGIMLEAIASHLCRSAPFW